MSKLHYIPIRTKGVRISRLCPFAIRDLSLDVCYGGNGKNRCDFFVRYHHDDSNSSWIVCKCPSTYIPQQLSLF